MRSWPESTRWATPNPYCRSVGVLITGAVLVLAWVFALVGWAPPGSMPGDDFADSAMRWMMALPVGGSFLVSGFMHSFLRHKTAEMIGWQSNGFQVEIGFVSYGIGIAGIWATMLGPQAWVVISVIVSVFLLGAAANHIKEMVTDKNFSPGNSLILIYDIGLPISLWALLISGGMLSAL